ncbi:hypothetical protein AtNW77_Chr3g0196371 [Arabidopsis thaliana]
MRLYLFLCNIIDVRMGADVPADALVDRLLVRLLDGLSDGLPEVLLVSNQLPGDPLRHPEPFTLNPWCIFLYVNPLSQDFPFLELNEIKSQRLYFDHLLGIKKPPTMTRRPKITSLPAQVVKTQDTSQLSLFGRLRH